MLLFMMIPGVNHRSFFFLPIEMSLSPLKSSDISCSNLVMLVHVVHYSTPLYMSTAQFVTVAILAQGALLAGAAEEAFLTFFWHLRARPNLFTTFASNSGVSISKMLRNT
jgi:hypothetical protein